MELTYTECKEALRLRLNALHQQATHWSNPCSPNQCTALIMLIKQGLNNNNSKEIRLAVIKEMIDVPIQSTKDLLKWEVSCLIDFIKEENDWSISQYGKKFVAEAERKITQRFEDTIINTTKI